ncbi:MAG: caspase family protein [Hydrogenophaga sp.]|nr:caspase family protein [Hydrogenophaga sp.]
MAKALIAIGVGNTSGDSFPKLKGAVGDAKAFHAWGKAQGFDCKLFVDERKKIRFADVFDALDTFVNQGIYSQIVVYFSGHGILKAPDCELWLLSGAPRIPSEAINVRGSIDNARASGVEHVVFISDACRSLPTDMTQASLSVGSSLFSVIRYTPPLPEVDVFYATLPGNVALEVPPDATNQRDRGLLTQCLLEALEGRVPEVIHAFDEAGQASRVVPCRPLKTWLTAALPLAAAAISLRLQQMPEARIESDPSCKYLAKVINVAPTPQLRPSSAEQAYGTQVIEALARYEPPGTRRLIASNASGGTRRRTRTHDAVPRLGHMLSLLPTHAAAIAKIVESTASAPLDASVSIKGAIVRSVVGAAQVELVTDSRDSWINLAPNSGAPLALRFENSSGFVVSPIPGYVTTVVVQNGRIATVNYTPARGSRNYAQYVTVAGELEARRAAAAVDALNGTFSIESSGSIALADYVRFFNRVDPTLGIYACYAYSRAGKFDEIDNIHNIMSMEPEAVPFDVAMLAARTSGTTFPSAAPGMPLMTQGWMMLGRFQQSLPTVLAQVREFLEPSLWATFSNAGMEILEAYVSEG